MFCLMFIAHISYRICLFLDCFVDVMNYVTSVQNKPCDISGMFV